MVKVLKLATLALGLAVTPALVQAATLAPAKAKVHAGKLHAGKHHHKKHRRHKKK